MSRTDVRRWLLLGAAAFLLRAAAAVVTEFFPMFPAYYYQDAVAAETLAAEWNGARAQGVPFTAALSSPQRAHAALVAAPFLIFGPRRLPAKLLIAALGAASVVLLGLVFLAAAPHNAALLAAGLAAAWPSHVFYTSQNFKEAPVFAFLFGALALLLGPVTTARAAGAVALLLLAGALRPAALSVAFVALTLGAAWAARSRQKRPRAALMACAALAACLLHHGVTTPAVDRLIPLPAPTEASPSAIPAPSSSAWTPAGLSRRRAERQESDRAFALKSAGREIATQIHPDARFSTWLDVALFLPPAAFAVLFQPLPGLYPMDGKLGRRLAACENLLLLLLSALAIRGLLRRREWTPPVVTLLSFFALLTAGSALLEFDLGGAGRHKLLYLPMLFPFAAEELLRRRRA